LKLCLGVKVEAEKRIGAIDGAGSRLVEKSPIHLGLDYNFLANLGSSISIYHHA